MAVQSPHTYYYGPVDYAGIILRTIGMFENQIIILRIIGMLRIRKC